MEEAFEHFTLLFLGYSVPRIFYRKLQFAVCCIRESDRYRTSLVGIFQGVAQQVEHHTCNLVHISHYAPVGKLVCIYQQSDTFLLGKRIEVRRPLLQTIHQVEAFKLKLHLAALYLAEVHYVVHDTLQSEGIALYDTQERPRTQVELTVFQNLLHGVYYQRERRAQLMTHIRKESKS